MGLRANAVRLQVDYDAVLTSSAQAESRVQGGEGLRVHNTFPPPEYRAHIAPRAASGVHGATVGDGKALPFKPLESFVCQTNHCLHLRLVFGGESQPPVVQSIGFFGTFLNFISDSSRHARYPATRWNSELPPSSSP